MDGSCFVPQNVLFFFIREKELKTAGPQKMGPRRPVDTAAHGLPREMKRVMGVMKGGRQGSMKDEKGLMGPLFASDQYGRWRMVVIYFV